MRHVKSSGFLAPLIILCVAATSTAFACKLDPSASFQEDFKKPDPQWPIDGKTTYFVDHQLAIKPDASYGFWITMPGFVFKNATYCVDVKTPSDATDPGTTATGGPVFWLIDNSNFYNVDVYPDGSYRVRRAMNSADNVILPKSKFEKINAGPGALNEIRVVALNNLVTLFFNGEKATEFRAQAPKDGGKVGFHADSDQNKPSEWRFLSIVVNE